MRRTSLITILATVLVVAFLLAGANWMSARSDQSATAGTLPASVLAQSASIVPADGSGVRSGISVTGEGSVAVKPDLARVTLGVEVTNQSASAAQQDAADKMDRVMSELKKAGIADKDVQTVRFDLSPDYDYSTRTPVQKGYRVSNLVQVTVRDISKIGGVLDSVVASGATRLQGISFDVSDPAAAGAQGREAAMKSARAKADQLAILAGVTLGPPVSIQESVSAPPAPIEVRTAAPAADTAAQTPISPGTQEIHTVVQVVYSIK